MLGVPRNECFHHKSSTEFEWKKIQLKIVIDTVSHYSAEKISLWFMLNLIFIMFLMTTRFENVNFCSYPKNLLCVCVFFFSFQEKQNKTKQTKQEQKPVSFDYIRRDSFLKCMHASVLFVLPPTLHSKPSAYSHIINERTNEWRNKQRIQSNVIILMNSCWKSKRDRMREHLYHFFRALSLSLIVQWKKNAAINYQDGVLQVATNKRNNNNNNWRNEVNQPNV